MANTSIDYESYLRVTELLQIQTLASEQTPLPAHDEMLFVIVHQTYELWFKQILHELKSILNLFEHPHVGEEHMGQLVLRLERIVQIFKLLIEQITVLETMTALDFLEFRDLLYPASGFQSTQFRLIENYLGLRPESRLFYGSGSYQDALSQSGKTAVQQSEQKTNLFDCVQSWLERTPFLKTDNFDFWSQYEQTLKQSFESEREMVENSPFLSPDETSRNLKLIEQNQTLFDSLFNFTAYEKNRGQGVIRLSYRAAQAALFIQLYRDEPALQLPFRLLNNLMEIDERLTTWRYRHALMAQRMLGTRMGTGGSSGAKYLQSSTAAHKIFSDFFMLTTFLIPRSKRPVLPLDLKRSLHFQFTSPWT